MAWNICNISQSGGATPTYVTQGSKTNKFSSSGTGSATATPSVALTALGTYLIHFCASQSSSNDSLSNSSITVGNWSIVEGTGTSTQLGTTNTLQQAPDTGNYYHGGSLRHYEDVTLVKVTALDSGKSRFYLQRSATCSGYGGDVIASIIAIKLA